ncbi:tyrosine-protein phosphatase non-receptor type 5 [Clonorchis sinensis]|uniref:protein-tyrosine-phosphatase n=1 Tax=Clonorchis sinensis TaxID=79923 RepID=G7YHA0_CLOSI|nr:tyrosine-protein phosphatase non-receptor type 5 [Clonorchis sinensis]
MLCVGLNASYVNGRRRVPLALVCGSQTLLTSTRWSQRNWRFIYRISQLLSCFLSTLCVWIGHVCFASTVAPRSSARIDRTPRLQCDGCQNSAFGCLHQLADQCLRQIYICFQIVALTCGVFYTRQLIADLTKWISFLYVLAKKFRNSLWNQFRSSCPNFIPQCGAFGHCVPISLLLSILPTQSLGQAVEGLTTQSNSLNGLSQTSKPRNFLGIGVGKSYLSPSEQPGRHKTNRFLIEDIALTPYVSVDTYETASAASLGGYTKKQLPVAFILVVVGVILVALLLLLAFWCVYRKRERQKGATFKQDTESASICEFGASASETFPDSASRSIVRTKETDVVVNEQSVARANRSCISYFCCCIPEHTATHLHHDTSALESAVTIEADRSSNDVPGPRIQRGEAPQTSSTFKCEAGIASERLSLDSSASPSLAARRRAAPLPRLVSALPSVLSPSPLIETRTVQVQPAEASHLAGAAVNKAAGVCTLPTTDASYREPDVLTQVTLRPKANGMPLGSSKHVIRSEPPQSTTSFSDSASHVTTAPPHPVRHRTRGLLESRRGSHTSLTLCLSPFVDPILDTTATSTAGRGGSLDEETGRTQAAVPHTRFAGLSAYEPNSLYHSAHTTCFGGKSGEDLDSAVATCEDVRCQIKPVRSVTDHTILELNATKSVSGTGAPCREPLDSLLSRHQYYSHHHYLHHRHLHYRPGDPHHRVELGRQCPHNTLSQQRSREVEQLLNASQPLTYEKLASKLRDNSSSLFQEFWDIPMNHPSKKELPIVGIGQKNRYQSILPNYSTRVILPMLNNDPATSYINANYIHGYGGQPNAFIATQGPMSHTVVDFWRMVWYSHAPAIVMITKLVEQQVVKCELYLPNSVPETVMSVTPFGMTPSSTTSNNTSCSFTSSPFSSDSPSLSDTSSVPRSARLHSSNPLDSGMTSLDEHSLAEPDVSKSTKLIECANPDACHLMALPGCAQYFGDIFVRVDSLERFEGYSVRALTLRHNLEERKVEHFWYTAWPDHSSPDTTPASARQLLQLVNATEACRKLSPLFHPLPSSSAIGKTESSTIQRDLLGTVMPISSLETIRGCDPHKHPAGLTTPATTTSTADGPIIVHCSAGVGRTGCFIALCIGCAQLQREGVVDILRIVSRLRLDRGGMVQRNEQYEFIHHALLEFPAYQECQRQRENQQ